MYGLKKGPLFFVIQLMLSHVLAFETLKQTANNMTIHFLLTIIINTKGSEINYCNKNIMFWSFFNSQIIIL